MKEERKKVVLVDDNPVYLKLARNILMAKYDVFTVPSAEKLFQILKKITPEIILLDVMMPVMNGYDAIKELKSRAETSGIPVVFLTGKDDPDNERLGLSLGAVDYIFKPFSPPQLLETIERCLPPQQGRP